MRIWTARFVSRRLLWALGVLGVVALGIPPAVLAHGPHLAAHRSGTACAAVNRGGTLTYGVDQDVTSFDPSMTQDNGSLWADLNIYDQLVRLSPDARRLVPDLATSWTIQQGGRIYIFHLRRDARFSDGTPVTAADVKFSFDHVRRPAAVVSWTLDAVRSDTVLDPYTFKVVLKKPSAPFLNALTLWGASILSAAAYRREGAAFKRHPVGSGPFSVQQWLPGQYVLLKRNPYYWERDACGRPYPYLAAVKLLYLPNDNTRMLKLESGAIDVAVDAPYNQLAALNQMSGVRAVTSPQMGQISIELNQKFAPFRDTRIIVAMNYAIDRSAMIRAVFFGHGEPAYSPLLIGNTYYTPKYGYRFNLARARRLMGASTFPRGFKVTLNTIAGDSIGAAIAEIMQSELRPLGIRMTINPLDSTTQYAVQQKEDFQMSYLYLTSDVIDPYENMLYCCVSNGGANSGYTGWKDPQADRLFWETETEMNFARRGQLYDTWQRLVMQRAPFIWLIDPTNHFAYRTNVHNFTIQSTVHWLLWPVWKG